MWSNTENFSGHRLWAYYLFRLIMNILIFMGFILTYHQKGYLELVMGNVEAAEEFCCSVNFSQFGDNLEVLCIAPVSGIISRD